MTNIITATLTKENWIRAYLTLWQGMLNLTEKEMAIACTLIRHYMSIRERVSDSSTAFYLTLSRNTRRKIKIEHNLSTAGFGNYLISFRKKGFLIEEDGNYLINDKVIPKTSVTFNFTISQR